MRWIFPYLVSATNSRRKSIVRRTGLNVMNVSFRPHEAKNVIAGKCVAGRKMKELILKGERR
jgi:hypothetical protein